MPSRETTTRVAAMVLILTALVFTILGSWTMVARSTIPLHLDGVVTQVDIRHEKHPGVDDAWFVSVDGDPRHVDVAVASKLEVGDQIAKDRWERQLVVNGEAREMGLSEDARAMLLLAPALIGCAVLLGMPKRRGRPVVRPGRRPQPQSHGARL